MYIVRCINRKMLAPLEKLKIYETCNFHVNLDLQDL